MAVKDTSENFTSKTPVLTEELEMYQEFATEGLNYLRTVENSLLTLETIPSDSETIDNIFKVFHTLYGLASFLNLTDIQILSQKSQILLNMLRKGNILLDDEILTVVLEATHGLQRLLILLSEQVKNKGTSKSPYFDASDTVSALTRVIEQKRDRGALKSPASSVETYPKDTEKIFARYRKLEEELKTSKETVTLKAETLKSLIADLQMAYREFNAMQSKLLKRQREIIREKEAIVTLNLQTQETTRAKNEFFANITHEIRTLINAILGFCDLISKTSADIKQKERLQAVMASGKLLLEIVNDILDLSKVESGRLTLEGVDFHLHHLINDVIQIMQIKIGKKPIKLYATIESGISATLMGDPTRLKQILINLIDNAIKFTEKGEITLLVSKEKTTADSPKDGGYDALRFVVHDTGLGIRDDKRSIIFESFRQADLSTTRKYGGSGLGLAICKGYVEAMGGKIWVESEVGKGSQFIFTINLKKVDRNQQGVKDEKRREDSKEDTNAVDQLAGRCRGITILVVEDSLPNQELIKAYFEHIGCVGDFASNGQEAIEKIRQSTYDLCFMDVIMPVMDGIEAVRVIRSQLKKQLPIVALTAATEHEQKNEGFRAGVTDYLEKPFDIVHLAKKILEHVKKS